ncbi:MAG: 4'-phosphopantetheinyl transferase superfamily protein [Methyloligellaceae bacterium]
MKPPSPPLQNALWVIPAGAVPCDTAPLCAAERERAARYTHERARARYVRGRVALRRILAMRLACRPRDIVLATRDGRPFLPDAPHLHVSLSHTPGWHAIAISSHPVGVDIERMDADFACETVAAAWFHPREKAFLAGLPANARRRAFYALWTQKEALVKALGAGLGFPLDAFAVAHTGGPVHFEPGQHETGAWSTLAFGTIAGCSLAVAFPGAERPHWRVDTLPAAPAAETLGDGHHAPAQG